MKKRKGAIAIFLPLIITVSCYLVFIPGLRVNQIMSGFGLYWH